MLSGLLERFHALIRRAYPRCVRDRDERRLNSLLEEMLNGSGDDEAGRRRILIRAIADAAKTLPRAWLAELRVGERASRRAASTRATPPRLSMMESLIQDLRFAVRGLARSRGFAAVAILTLALGAGANTAVFSVVSAVLLRPLPYAQPERLVTVWPELGAFNRPLLERVADGMPALESLTGVAMLNLTASGDGEPQEVPALVVSANHFDVLGLRPMLGRGFAPGEDVAGGGDVVVLSYEFWRTRYGADPSIIGRRIRLSSPTHDTYEVIGVMGPEHRPVSTGILSGSMAGGPRAWVPNDLAVGELATNGAWWISLRIGRLAPGNTREQAEAQLRSLAHEVRPEVPNLITEDDARFASVAVLHDAGIGPLRGTLWMLFGAVGFVLLIACVNVANLLLVRGEARTRELSLRRALGAGGRRLVRQLLTEALVLALAGGTAGLLVAVGLLHVIVAGSPPDVPQIAAVHLDGTVLTFTLVVACVAALVFGAAPAIRAGRVAVGSIARQGAKGSIGSSRGVMSGTLVVVEVALAVVLVTGSGLMLRTLDKLNRVDPGFRAEGVLVFRPSPSPARHRGGAGYHRFYDDVLGRVRAVPGVESAGAIQILPVTTTSWTNPIYPEGHVVREGASPPTANFRMVTPGYFETLRIPLLAGRSIQQTDHEDSPGAVVVNRVFAERYWPGADPIGKEIRFVTADGEARRVVGVVGDVRQRSLDQPPAPELYVPYAQIPWQVSLWLMVRARDGDPARLAPAIRDAVWSVDAETPIAQMEPLEAVVGRSAAMTRFLTLLLGFFGLLALVLGAVGVYGVTAYTVARRLPEFGVRMVLGATTRDVLASAIGRGGAPVAAGIGIGGLAALSLTGLLRSLLFEVGPRDPATFAAAAGLLAVVGLAALLLPTLRATRVDPIATLRHE